MNIPSRPLASAAVLFAALIIVNTLSSCADVPAVAAPTGEYFPAGIALVRIQAGSFEMGSPWNEDGRRNDEIGQHQARIGSDFFLGKNPVTKAQWRVVMGFVPGESADTDDQAPVAGLSWNDAMAFCQKITDEERAAGRLPPGYVYRLPTEAQWEYAARAGTTGTRYGELDAIAWYRDNGGGNLHPVGKKAPNAWGLHDMIGNVWEWCADQYVPPGLQRAQAEGAIIFGPPQPTMRSLRGGSIFDGPDRCRAAARRHNRQDLRQANFGFRLALVPEGGP